MFNDVTLCLTVSIAVKRNHNHLLLQRKTFNWSQLSVSDIQSIIFVAELDFMQADKVLEKKLRVLYLYLQEAERVYFTLGTAWR